MYSEIVPWNVNLATLLKLKPKAIILSGGPSSVLEDEAPKPRKEVLSYFLSGKVPLLGICYGHQLLSLMAGGKVSKGNKGEYGPSILKIKKFDLLFSETPPSQKVWMSHRDYVEVPPPNATVLASTKYSKIAALKYDEHIYSLQFHPEVKHTEHGKKILSNFLYKVARLNAVWKIDNITRHVMERVNKEYKGGNILAAVSGGVDSLTAAYIVSLVAGKENLHVVFIDTGLLRKGEAKEVLSLLRKLGFKYVHFINASRRFLERLRGVTDPEEKRKTIAITFAEIFTETKNKLEKKFGSFTYLVQGTIYPDRIESGKVGSNSAKIKSHHNVVMPKLNIKILEPLAELYKDEVRKLALKLGLSKELALKHPFPGPGLAVRIIGEVTEEKLRVIRKATAIVEEELKRNNFYESLWQAFPVLLPFKSVGVMGDMRTYEYVIALRFVISEDAMTAEFAKMKWELLEKIATRIVNEVEGVNRVLYDLTNKPPATIEFE